MDIEKETIFTIILSSKEVAAIKKYHGILSDTKLIESGFSENGLSILREFYGMLDNEE